MTEVMRTYILVAYSLLTSKKTIKPIFRKVYGLNDKMPMILSQYQLRAIVSLNGGL